jgi:hypothetical protein
MSLNSSSGGSNYSNTEPIELYDDCSRGMSLVIYPTSSQLFNGTAYDFGIKLTSTYWTIDNYTYSLRLSNGTIVGSDDSSLSGTTITNSYNVNNQSVIYLDYTFSSNCGNTLSGSTRWLISNTGYTSWSVKHFFTRLDSYLTVGMFGLDNFGRYLIIFLILFVTVGVMSYKYGQTSPLAISAMIFLVIYFFDVIVNLIPPIYNLQGNEIPNILTYLAGIILAVFVLKEVTN